MKVFCDTSVLIAGAVKAHPHFGRAYVLLQDIAAKKHEGWCAAHSLAESYSVLTTLPVMPRIAPAEAMAIIKQNVLARFKLVPASTRNYQRALGACLAAGMSGGVVYDALLVECARQSKCEHIYTFNVSHFLRLAPDLASRISAP